jgi:hypothetical protein
MQATNGFISALSVVDSFSAKSWRVLAGGISRMKIQMTVAATIMVTFVSSLASTTEY